MTRSPVSRISLLLALVASACAGSQPKPAESPAAVAVVALTKRADVALRPADEARPALGVAVNAAAPEALAKTLDELSTQLQLEMKLGQSALDQLTTTTLAGVTLNREQLGRLDAEQAIGVAVLVSGPAKGSCAAIIFKDEDLAEKTLNELGPAKEGSDGISARKLPSGDEVWTALNDRTLLAATSREALVAAGALALEAQQAKRDGLVGVTLYPQTLAQSQGLPLPALVEMASASMAGDLAKAQAALGEGDGEGKGKGKKAKGKKAKGKKAEAEEITPGMIKMLLATFRAMAQPIVEAQAVNLYLQVGNKEGLVVRTEIVPLPNTPSAARTAGPFTLDTKLAIADDRTGVIAFGPAGAGTAAAIAALSETGPAGKAMAKQFQAMTSELVSGASCTLQTAPPMNSVCTMELRPGVTPARALDGYAAIMKTSQAWQDEVLGPKKGKVKVTRKKDVLEVEMTTLGGSPSTLAMQEAMWGGKTQRYAVAVREGRLVQAQGPKPGALLASWSASKAAAGKATILPSVLERAKGADVLVYIDFPSMFSTIGKNAKEPQVKQLGAMMGAVPGLTELSAPTVLTMWGGKTTVIDLQLPFQTLANVAQVVKPFLGTMGAPAAAPGAEKAPAPATPPAQ